MSDAGESRWTPEQAQAIGAKTSNLLVAAAAGAGKTAVLVERIIRKITDDKNPVDIDRMLIVTFTNAAAAEMRERIGAAIEKSMDKKNSSKILQRQLTLLNKASITTIHSFCLEVIKNNFHSIDIDPNFRIADDTEATLMRLEALEDMFEEKYEAEKCTDDFLRLVECYGGSKDDSKLQEIVLSVFRFIQSSPWPHRWLAEMTEKFNIDDTFVFDDTPWAQILKRSLKVQLEGLAATMERTVKTVEANPELAPYLTTFNDNLLEIKGLLKNCDNSWEVLYNGFKSLDFGRLSGKVKAADEAVKKNVQDTRKRVKADLDKIKRNIFWADMEDIKASIKRLYPLMKCLSELVIELGESYAAKKREKGLLDFNDLEHMCLKILCENHDIAENYKKKFHDIFVDEYQDSNDVQEEIIKRISREDMGEPNIFMVGDVKQSIYRFRQAKPELFTSKYESYINAEEEKYRKIKLFKNFRSRGNIISGVNYIFKQIMSKEIGELEYDDEEALNIGADYPHYEGDMLSHGNIEVNLVDFGASSYDKEDDLENSFEDEGEGEPEEADFKGQEEPPDIMQSEARIVGRRITELMGIDGGSPFKVYDRDKKEYRELRYKDIVILLRATKTWAEVFVEELSKLGIPAYADSGSGYFRTTEVQTVMAILNIIDNPMQDIPLLAVMRSPVFGFNAEELVDIRLVDREISFYEALRKYAGAPDIYNKAKIDEFLSRLDVWRERARYTPTDELIWYIYSETGYYAYAGAMSGGLQRQANLRILFQRAKQYEATSYKGLFNFINFINKMQSSKGDMGGAKILGENEDVVRVMSIHKSKGLEFPVVFVSGAGKGFNLMDMNASILLHHELGFGPDYVDHVERIQYPSIAKEAIRSKTKLESLSEEMRILYVAFTRAKEKLIITGSLSNLNKAIGRWNEAADGRQAKIPPYHIMKGKTYLDWICPSLIRHKDCSILSSASDGCNGYCFDDDSRWSINIYNQGDIAEVGRISKENQGNLIELLNEIADRESTKTGRKAVDERLNWRYPYREAAAIPAKVSVTELKRYNREYQEEFASSIFIPPLIKKPSFLQAGRELSAAEKGTAMHLVLQHIDLHKTNSKDDIEEQINCLVQKEIMLRQEADSVNINVIQEFFSSDLGRRMIKAEALYREAPFNININCKELHPKLEGKAFDDETVMLQGVIDCYFEEGDNIILIDYKTGSWSEIYRQQLKYYADVLERLRGKKVAERYAVMLPVEAGSKLYIKRVYK